MDREDIIQWLIAIPMLLIGLGIDILLIIALIKFIWG